MWDDVVFYVISLEKSSKGAKVDYHLHAYLCMQSKWQCDVIAPFVREMPVCRSCDVQFARSPKAAKKYCSKEDVFLLSNVKVSDLHIHYRIYLWAKSTPYFKPNDPFVVQHRFCYRYLSQCHALWRRDIRARFERFEPVGTSFRNWSLVVAEWWNQRIKAVNLKFRQLYLWGPSNTGKSTYVEILIGVNRDYVYYPGIGKFFMQDFDPSFHKLIVFEEFDIKFHVPSMLKRLLEGRNFAYPA